MEKKQENQPQNIPQIINQDPEFFEVFLPNRISHELLIPPDFIKHFDQKIPESVILKDLSGKVWHVDIKQEEHYVFFENGWNKFVNDKNLDLGEFMVFRYDRRSSSPSFTVRIFGKSACKREDKDRRKTVMNCVIDKEESYTDSSPIRKCQRNR